MAGSQPAPPGMTDDEAAYFVQELESSAGDLASMDTEGAAQIAQNFALAADEITRLRRWLSYLALDDSDAQSALNGAAAPEAESDG